MDMQGTHFLLLTPDTPTFTSDSDHQEEAIVDNNNL